MLGCESSMVFYLSGLYNVISLFWQISDHIEGSILYLDAGCVESFQTLGGFPLLLDHGVHVVCSLENLTSLDAVR